MTTIQDTKISAEKTSNFLASAMPEIYKCMPDWQKVVSGVKSEREQVASK